MTWGKRQRWSPPRGNGKTIHTVRHKPVEGWQHDQNLDGPATPEEVEQAENIEFERLMEQPPLNIDPPGIIRGRRR